MKFRLFALFLSAFMLFTGCAAMTQGNNVNAAEQSAPTAATTYSPTAQPKASANVPTLTREQAQAIALEHAGLTAEQVTHLRTEYEIDDGIARYEVEFRQGRREYNYEINAENGTILSYDRDD